MTRIGNYSVQCLGMGMYAEQTLAGVDNNQNVVPLHELYIRETIY